MYFNMYEDALIQMGIKFDDVFKISDRMQESELPDKVLEVIVNNDNLILSVPQEMYSWSSETFDKLQQGLESCEIKSQAILEYSNTYLRKRFDRELSEAGFLQHEPSVALANLLEMYAIGEYHQELFLN